MGDEWAINFIINRLEGTPTQHIESDVDVKMELDFDPKLMIENRLKMLAERAPALPNPSEEPDVPT